MSHQLRARLKKRMRLKKKSLEGGDDGQVAGFSTSSRGANE